MAVEAKDTLFIQQLALKTYIGVYAHEKKIKQTVILDLSLDYDSQIAGQSDCLGDALDYAALVNSLRVFLADLHCHLLEHLAEKICQHIFATFPCSKINLSLSKPQALGNGARVGLKVERRR